jgi:uncharacterized sulfatase
MPRPSFVFLMVDTQDTRLVGAYGNPAMRTPHLDALADDGVLFERAYTSSPLCTPARAGIFTGMMSHTAGAWTNSLGLYEKVQTMGTRFHAAGYRSAYVGKWHLDGHDYFGDGICPPGWEDRYWYDGRRYLEELSEDDRVRWRQKLSSYKSLVEADVQAGFTWAHRSTNRALEFLSEAGDDPFVLVVSYDEPHHPWVCPPEFVEPFLDYELPIGPSVQDDLADKPAHHLEWSRAVRARASDRGTLRFPIYFGCNSYVDHEIGRVIDAARERRDTWILYTADHGDMLGAHRLFNKGPAMYEEITRIPLIIRAPGARSGSRNPSVVSHLDLLPTMLGAAGVEVPPALVGAPLVGLLNDERQDLEREAFIEYNRYEVAHDGFGGGQPIRCLVRWPWKLVLNLMDRDELYHLGDDPHELRNRIDEPGCAAERDSVHDALLDMMDRERDPMRGWHWERRSWRPIQRRGFDGPTRPNPPDGWRPSYLEYFTGLPAQRDGADD